MTFYEFVKEQDDSSDEWTESFFNHWFDVMKNGKHEGDCTNVPMTCSLCLLETLLGEYRNRAPGQHHYFPERSNQEPGVGAGRSGLK